MASAKGARMAAMWGTQQIQDGEKRVLGELGTGYDSAMGFLGQGRDQYKPYAERYGAGSSMYSDALGLGGSEGKTRAQEAFRGYNPGYDFAMDQGLQALMRKRAAGGMLNSGNADADTMQYAQGLANQGYNSWLDRLNQMDQRGLATAGQMAGSYGQQAGLTSDYYGKRAGIINDNINNIVGMGTSALRAGDAARAQNQAALMGGLNAAIGLVSPALSSIMSGGMSGMGGMGGGGGGGMFTSLFGGGGGSGAGMSPMSLLPGALF